MSFDERMKRHNHLRETVERAKSYQRHDRPKGPAARSVRSACATMLFSPTDEEFEEMVRLVDRR